MSETLVDRIEPRPPTKMSKSCWYEPEKGEGPVFHCTTPAVSVS